MRKAIVNICILTMLTLVPATWMTSTFMLSGCGKKASPKPPSGNRPPKVTDLGYSISANTIKLSWTIPKTSDKAKSPATGFLIYRSKQSSAEDDCPNCPIYFLKIEDVPVRGGVSGKPEPSVVFAQDIEPGYRYIYKVKAYDDDGVVGRDSNVIDFSY
jgi:rRNA maturation protein Nop10